MRVVCIYIYSDPPIFISYNYYLTKMSQIFTIDQFNNMINIYSNGELNIQLTLSDLSKIGDIRLMDLSYKDNLLKKGVDLFKIKNLYYPDRIILAFEKYIQRKGDYYFFYINRNVHKVLIKTLAEYIEIMGSNLNSPLVEWNACTLCGIETLDKYHNNCVKKRNLYEIFRNTENGMKIENIMTDLVVEKYLITHVYYEATNEKLMENCFMNMTKSELLNFIDVKHSEKLLFPASSFVNFKLLASDYVISKCLRIVKNGF